MNIEICKIKSITSSKNHYKGRGKVRETLEIVLENKNRKTSSYHEGFESYFGDKRKIGVKSEKTKKLFRK